MHNHNELLGLELGLRITHLGKRSIMHNIVIYKPVAKVQGVKADQIVQNSPKFKKKITKKIEKFSQK